MSQIRNTKKKKLLNNYFNELRQQKIFALQF